LEKASDPESGAEVHASRVGSHSSTIFDRVAFLAWVMDDEGLAFRIAREGILATACTDDTQVKSSNKEIPCAS
jgi:hypothetical protein